MSETQTAIPEPTTDCTDCNDNAIVESVAGKTLPGGGALRGRRDEAIQLVEETVASVEMDPCSDGEAAREAANRDLIRRALARVAALQPARMHPSAATDLGGCVETDDLSAAGLTRQQLDDLLSGAGRTRMRQWLEGLGPAERSVFVLRAVMGRSSTESAQLLQQATGDPWMEDPCGRGLPRGALLARQFARPFSAHAH